MDKENVVDVVEMTHDEADLLKKFNDAYNLGIKTEKLKQSGTTITYASWSDVWAKAKTIDPKITYEILMFGDRYDQPYIYDETLGYMVWTQVTMHGQTYKMWLPVLDGAFNQMKKEPYKFKTKSGYERSVDAATYFDINKTIMRCLVKNMAMFGLGLKLYSGEDLPEPEDTTKVELPEVDENGVSKKALEEIAKAKEKTPKTEQDKTKEENKVKTPEPPKETPEPPYEPLFKNDVPFTELDEIEKPKPIHPNKLNKILGFRNSQTPDRKAAFDKWLMEKYEANDPIRLTDAQADAVMEKCHLK